MRVIFAGTPEVAAFTLEKLLESDHEVVAVLTRPDARVGRRRTLQPSPVKRVALEAGIEVLEASSLRGADEASAAVVQRLHELAPDCIPVVAYGALVPAELLELPKHGWINLHFSLLPAWRGAAPVQAAIAAGDSETGVSVFQIEEGLDTGPVLASHAVPIQSSTTSGELLTQLATVGSDVLRDCLDNLAAGTAEFTPQEDSQSSYAPKISAENTQIDWTASANRIDCAIRAYNPAPGAWTTLDGQRFKIYLGMPATETADSEQAKQLAPGEIATTKTALYVGTGEGILELTEIQPFGKKRMAAADYIRGAAIDGKVFG